MSMKSQTVNTKWPADESSHVAETLVIDGSGWELKILGYCEVTNPGGLQQFSPSVAVAVLLDGLFVDRVPMNPLDILTPDPSSWKRAVMGIVLRVKGRLESSQAPDPSDAVEALPDALAKARVLAARALVSAQAAYLIEIIPSMDAASMWREADVRLVMDG